MLVLAFLKLFYNIIYIYIYLYTPVTTHASLYPYMYSHLQAKAESGYCIHIARSDSIFYILQRASRIKTKLRYSVLHACTVDINAVSFKGNICVRKLKHYWIRGASYIEHTQNNKKKSFYIKNIKMKKSKRYSAKSVQSIFILVLSCYLENAEIVFIFVNAATAAYFCGIVLGILMIDFKKNILGIFSTRHFWQKFGTQNWIELIFFREILLFCCVNLNFREKNVEGRYTQLGLFI